MASDTLENLRDKWATFDGVSSTLATYQHTCMDVTHYKSENIYSLK